MRLISDVPRGIEMVALRTVFPKRRTIGVPPLGVIVTTQAEGDALGFSVESATSAALFGWLQTLEAQHGVTASALNIAENADATLQAQGEFRGVRHHDGAENRVVNQGRRAFWHRSA